MKPSIGRVVIVAINPEKTPNNNATEAPAVITRVFSDTLINVRALTESDDTPLWLTSVTLHDERPDNPQHAAWWPPRV